MADINRKRTINSILVLVTLVFLSQACSPTAPVPSTTNESVTSAPATIGVTSIPTAQTEQSTQSVQPIQLVGQPSFIQYGNVVEYTFMVKNPNQGYAVLAQQYKVTISDAGGNVLDTAPMNIINTLLPGDQTAVLQYGNVGDNQTAAKVDVTLSPNTGILRKVTVTLPLFSAKEDQLIHFTDNDFYEITGTLQSNLEQNMVYRMNSEVHLTGLAFDETGNFVGGGAVDLTYVPAKSQVAFTMQVNKLVGNPAKIELYTQLVDFDILQSADTNENLVSVVAQNIIVNNETGSYLGGFIIQNTDKQRAITNLVYQITAYDTKGVLSTLVQPVSCLLFPGETTGIAVTGGGVPGIKPDKIELQVGSGAIYTGSLTAGPFQTAELTFIPASSEPGSTPKITGVVKNQSGTDFNGVLQVDTLAFDAQGNILDGGSITVTSVPANGSTPFTVDLSPGFQGSEAKVEAFINIDASNLQP